MASEIVNTLLSFQPDAEELQQRVNYDKEARDFFHRIHTLSPSTFLKGADTPQDLLSVLDSSRNSMAYAVALRHRIEAAISKKNTDQLQPGNSLWTKLVTFLETFDPIQMRYAGDYWKRLVDYVEQSARGSGSPAFAISPIRSAMLRLDPTSGTFTTTHLSFIRLCMETRSYAAAVPILDNYIHSLPTALPKETREGLEYSVLAADTVPSGEFIYSNKSGHTDKVTLADLHEYYVLGAMAYLGVRQFKDAMRFLEHVLVTPTGNAASGLMLEAYKKWLLISCLVDKSHKATPRTMTGNALKHLKGASRAYEALADAFYQLNNLPKLKAQVHAGRDLWSEDGNLGLVEELVEQQNRAYVSRLSRTFSAIPVSNIASNVGSDVEQVTGFVETLIQTGVLNGRLEHSDKAGVGAVLRFYLDPTQGPLAKTEKQQQQALLEQTRRTKVLAEQVRDADYRLSTTKEYVEYVKRQNKKAANASSGGDAMDVTFDQDDIDEDIMGDMR